MMSTAGGASALQAAFKSATNSEMAEMMTGSIGSDSAKSKEPGTGDTPFARAAGMGRESN